MKQIYPPHFYEPIRRQIASDVVSKELRKLLPAIPKNLWPKIDVNVEEWFDQKKFELAFVQDFWNGFEGISQGFKLKNLLPYITAQNIQWEEKNIGMDNLIFMTNLPIYENIFQAPFKSQELIEYLNNPSNHKQLLEFKEDSVLHAKSSVPRDNYPVILLKTENGYRILDGHRRVIRAILHHQSSIKTYVGHFISSEEIPKNFWISIGFLRNITRLADLNKNNDAIVRSVITLLKKLYQDHDNVKIAFQGRILESANFSQELRDRLTKEIIMRV